jgi:glycosyltransferase involved in cell wall biosynthesis
MTSVSYLTSHKGSKADLRRCIKSVVADAKYSGITDYEHLVFLDGLGGEYCDDALSSFIEDSRIKIKHSETNRGKAACVNELIRSAEGEFILFLDSDDWSFPGRTRLQLQVIEREPETILGSNYYAWDGAGGFRESVYPISDIDIKINFWRFPFLLYSSICIRKEDFVGNNLYFDESLRAGIDYEFYSRAFQKLRVKNTVEHMVCYRAGNKGGITKSPESRREQLRVHRDVMLSLLGLDAEKDSDLIGYIFSLVINGKKPKLTDSAGTQLAKFRASKFNRHCRRYFKNSVSDILLENSLSRVFDS